MRVTQMPAGGSTGSVHRSISVAPAPRTYENHSTIDIKKILSPALKRMITFWQG